MKFIQSISFSLVIFILRASLLNALTNSEKNKLLQDYDKYKPPFSNNSGFAEMKVNIRLLHLFLTMDSEEEAFTITGVLHFVWKDIRLASKQIFSISLDKIWSGVPNIAYKAGSTMLDLGSGEKERNHAIVLSRGVVVGATVITFRTVKACHSDLTDWPHDTKVCTVYFISPAINGPGVQYDLVNVFYTGNEQSIADTVECEGWSIEKLDFHSENDHTQILLSFHLKRNNAKLSNYFYIPSIVSLIVSISLFFLEPQSSERFLLLLLITIIHFYILKSLSVLVPQYNDQRPTIELFIKMSTILTLIQTFLVIICRALVVIEYNPSFLSKTVSKVVMNPVLKTIFLLEIEPKVASELMEDQDEDEESILIATKHQTKKEWKLICRIIHQATFYLTVLFSVYLVYIVI
ncbi:gamma-aminobutyric acid receptor subunit beta-2 isoform X1 [Nilaparvata lugens]|uniref:gamma-aminobutyric acid receptor subunit beta-2 isoform X1 n=1 Tax=Nilaparvata lugens TaxID=108931 RepID=UPI000B9952E9|nr:gamma-aminobutyric acid receptor subunit beta-2 isoform X1 [Nilaparvata lugens]